jgi:diguanylate cyclase (GGDEF)-like protein/PAS domain S-box-containing protein
MTRIINFNQQSTLRQIFNRRLLLLLVSFSAFMSIVIVLAYQLQIDRFNRAALAQSLNQFQSRLKDQQDIWTERSNNLLDVIEWSGLLMLQGQKRQDKLQSFFTAQNENLGIDGVVITDRNTDQSIFSFWTNAEHPISEKVFASSQSLWYDDEHAVLYSLKKKNIQVPGAQVLNIYFFIVWDNAMLSSLHYPDDIAIVSLGNQPMLSSAGGLALQALLPFETGYRRLMINDHNFHQDSVVLGEVTMKNNRVLPLFLTVRSPEKNTLPIQLLLAESISLIMLFGILLFVFIGRWMRRLGVRLDNLSQAALNFRRENKVIVSEVTKQYIRDSEAGENDQVSLLAQELSTLMTSATLRDEEQRTYLQTLELLQDAVIEFKPTGRIIRATDAWHKMTGVTDLVSCAIDDCIAPEDIENVMEQIGALTHEQKQQVNIRFRLVRINDGNVHYWVEGRFAAVKINDKVVSIRGVVRDITNTYQQERQINHMALHDALTDLPNRILLEDRMQMAISRAERSGKRVALGFVDLDHFKQVNDNFGHKIGDQMLKEVTNKFTEALRGTDTLSRWGGDEFVVLCPDLESLSDAKDIAAKLSLLSQQNISIEGTDIPFIFSAGFAVYPDDASNSATLLAQADRAMFYAKAQGRNNIQFFNAIAGKETGRQSFYIQSRLSNAINKNEIEAWLQPLISAKTGKVIGAEVLARWHEPEQGWIPPAVFIPMAESLGMIDRLGQSVWQQALHAFALLPVDHRLSVNLSKRQLFSNTIVQKFCDDVKNAGVSPSRLMLEITESIALSDVSFARERIIELDSKGFGIAVDDFGVGYSSLSQLHEIPADELKLDISFVRRIHSKTGFSMASAILSIAKSLNMECVAEGVEDERTAELLIKMGVDVLQGYHFSQAMPIGDYIAWLEKYEKDSTR